MSELSSMRDLYSAYIDVRLPELSKHSLSYVPGVCEKLSYVPGVCEKIIQNTRIQIFSDEVLLATKTITSENRFMYRVMSGSVIDSHCFRVCPAPVVEDLQALAIPLDKPVRITIELTLAKPSDYVMVAAPGIDLASVSFEQPTITLHVPRLEIKQDESYA